MRTTSLVLTAVLLLAGAGMARGAEGTEEIVKLAQSGLSEDVLLAYVEAAPGTYDLTADDLVYLNDLGISEKVIAAMLSHGKVATDTAAGLTSAPVADATPAVTEVAPSPAAPLYGGTPMAESAGQPSLQIAPSTSGALAPPVYQATPVAPLVGDPGVPFVASTPIALPPADDHADITYFYQSLAPYGAWVSEPDYGWVWQPTAVMVDPGWQPYRQGGHWVWTDSGWYWQSNYSWGWAPFHYGRWAYSSHHRWIWIPDNVWGPAWVSWRCSDDDFGWAPLPPGAMWDARLGFSYRGAQVGFDFDFHLGNDHFTFVPRHRFLDRNLASSAWSRQHAAGIFNRTSILNHTYAYNNNRIIHQGIPVQSVAQVTQRKLEPRRIVDLHPTAGQPLTRGRVTRDQVAAFRPKLGDKPAADPPTVLARRNAEQERQRRTSGAPLTGPVANRPNLQKTTPVVTTRPANPAGKDQTSDQRRTSGAPLTGPVTSRPDRQKTTPVVITRPLDPLPKDQTSELQRKQQDAARKLADQQAQNAQRAKEQEAARRQQDEAARKQQDAARKQAEQQAQNAQRAKEQDAARKLAEQQTQNAQRAKDQEAARRQQEEAARRQQDAARKQAEQQAQNAQRAKEQAAAQRQQEEAARRQQDAARKQAEQQAQNAQRAKEQAAAQRQQEEAARRQQDAARQQAEQQAQNAQRAKEQAAAQRQQQVRTPPAPQRQVAPAPQRQTPPAPPAAVRSAAPSTAPASDPNATDTKNAKGRGKK